MSMEDGTGSFHCEWLGSWASPVGKQSKFGDPKLYSPLQPKLSHWSCHKLRCFQFPDKPKKSCAFPAKQHASISKNEEIITDPMLNQMFWRVIQYEGWRGLHFLAWYPLSSMAMEKCKKILRVFPFECPFIGGFPLPLITRRYLRLA